MSRVALTCGALLALLWSTAAAQTAPELRGTVRDRAGASVAGALVELVEAGTHGWSNAAGAYQVRAAEAGRYTVRVSRIGFRAAQFVVVLAAGASTTLDAELAPQAVRVDSLLVDAPGTAQGVTLERAAIMRSAAATAAEAIATVPGVVLIASTPGGPQRVSMRGSEARQVLVLLDGVPLNDPLTGEADLSRIRAEQIERITVIPGGGSARYGARALGGVVVIESRAPHEGRAASVAVGSLGAVSAAVAAGGAAPIGWSLGLSANRSAGDFDYELPAVTGRMRGERVNADARAARGFAQLQYTGRAGQLRLRTSLEKQQRGLPGTAFAPAPAARQRALASRASLQWEAPERFAQARALLAYNRDWVRFSDAHPPAGLPYDDTITVGELYGRAAVQGNVRPVTVSAALEARWLDIDTRTLEQEARSPGSLSIGTELQWPRAGAPGPWSAQAQLRVERDHGQARTFAAHALTIAFDRVVHVRLTQQSSYAPPTLGDQHFRESYGVAPNPDLRAERVPNELAALIYWIGVQRELQVRTTISAWVGNTNDLIVWLPDYRFIWSPRNTDVRRRGAEGSFALQHRDLALNVGWAYAQVTYRELAEPDVQVLYRPRHTGNIALQRTGARWHARVEARYTGARNTAPTDLNALPGFWSVNAGLGGHARVAGFPLEARLTIERIDNGHESLIFGFPQPARVLGIELRVSDKVRR